LFSNLIIKFNNKIPMINLELKAWLEGYLEDKLTKEQIEKVINKVEEYGSVDYTSRMFTYPCNGKCDYPTTWHGTPPACKTCGKPAQIFEIIC